MTVLRGQREHRPVDPRALVELRREDLREGGGARTCVTPPRARVEGRRVDDVQVQRVDADVRDAKAVRVVPVPDLGEGLAAVERLVEAGLVRAGLEASRAAVADGVREAANGLRRTD